jgi:hypothetical protein
MNPITTIISIASLALALTWSIPSQAQPFIGFPDADVESGRFLYPPIEFSALQSLNVCVGDAARVLPPHPGQGLPGDRPLLFEIELFSLDGAPLMAPVQTLLEPALLARCVTIDGTTTDLADSATPETVVTMVTLVSASPAVEGPRLPPSPVTSLDFSTHTGGPHMPLLPAVQAQAPYAPGQYGKYGYRPQFYLRSSDVPAQVFGPVRMQPGQVLEVCAADAAALTGGVMPADGGILDWRVEVHASRSRGQTVFDDISVDRQVDGCSGEISFDELAMHEPVPPEEPNIVVALILVYAEAPPGRRVVPMATGRLTSEEPEAVPLLLPAVQAAREAAR